MVLDPVADGEVVLAARSLSLDGYVRGDQLLDTLDHALDRALDHTGTGRAGLWGRIVELADPTLWWLPPLETRGNLGRRREEQPPADPEHLEVRTSLAGHAAVADPDHPLHLANGDLDHGVTRPPFHPARVAAALRALTHHPASDLDPGPDLGVVLGPPSFPTGCAVAGDHAALIAGQPTPLTLSATVGLVVDRGRWPALEVTGLPPRTTTTGFVDAVFAHLRTSRRLIADYDDHTTDGDHVSRWRLAPGADPDQAREFVLGLPGMRQHSTARLPRPAAATLRAWVDAHGPDHAHHVAADLTGALRPDGADAARQRWHQPHPD